MQPLCFCHWGNICHSRDTHVSTQAVGRPADSARLQGNISVQPVSGAMLLQEWDGGQRAKRAAPPPNGHVNRRCTVKGSLLFPLEAPKASGSSVTLMYTLDYPLSAF